MLLTEKRGDFLYYIKHKNESGFFKRRLFIAIFAVLLIIVLTELQLRPMMKNVIENKAKNLFTETVSNTVSDILSEEDIDYSDLVEIVTDSEGKVTSVQVDSAAVNLLSNKLSAKLSEELGSANDVSTQIDFGTLTGIRLLGGCGPDVNLVLRLDGGVTVNIREFFVTEGINQTLHSVRCEVTASVVAYIPGMSESIGISVEVPLVNTVIVGDVPESYTYVNGDQSDTIGRIFDYGDPYGSDVLSD